MLGASVKDAYRDRQREGGRGECVYACVHFGLILQWSHHAQHKRVLRVLTTAVNIHAGCRFLLRTEGAHGTGAMRPCPARRRRQRP